VGSFSVHKPSPALIIVLLLPSFTLHTEVLLNKKNSVSALWFTVFGYASSTQQAISKSEKEDEGQRVLHMSQYNIITFESPSLQVFKKCVDMALQDMI